MCVVMDDKVTALCISEYYVILLITLTFQSLIFYLYLQISSPQYRIIRIYDTKNCREYFIYLYLG